MATGSISSIGIGSGLQLQDMLEQLREVDEQQIKTKQGDIDRFKLQLDEFTQVKNSLLSLKSKALSLSLSSAYLKRTAATSGEDVVAATVADGATVQSLAIDVQRLATRSSWSASDGRSAASDSINVPTNRYSATGLAAASDTFIAANKEVTITYGTGDTQQELTIAGGAGGKSLDEVVTEINASALAGDITAKAKQIDGKYYLLVSSDAADPQGEANRVEITSTAGLNFTAEPPAAMSHFSRSGVSAVTENVLAANSQFVLNYGSGSTYTVSGGSSGKSLQSVVAEIDALSGVSAAAKQIGNFYYLHISSEEVNPDEASQVTISGNTSSIAFQQGDPDDAFSYEVDGSATLIHVPKETTLAGLAGLINADSGNLGVTASAVDTGISDTPYKLVLEAKETGEDHRISVIDANQLDLTLEEKQGAAAASLNASFSINQIDYERQTNSLDDFLSGVDLTLKKVGTATITISADNDGISEVVTGLVSAYNEAVQGIRAETGYTTETGELGILAGTTVGSLIFDLQSLMSRSIAGSEELITRTVNADGTVTTTDKNIRTLFDLGLELNRDGSITLDQAVLEDAITNNMDGLQRFLLGDEDEGLTGFASQANEYLRTLTSGTGQLDAEKTAAQAKIDELELQIENETSRLDRKYESLAQQFIELDRYMNQMTSISNYLTSQFDSLSKMWGAGGNKNS